MDPRTAAVVASLTALARAWPEPPDGAHAPRKDSGQGPAAAGEEEHMRQD
jgi:hypothetical protein